MLQNIGNIIKRKTIPPTPILLLEERQLIEMFRKNIDSIEKLTDDPNCTFIFHNLVLQFDSTFHNIKPEHLSINGIDKILQRYVKLCIKYGNSFFQNCDDECQKFFNSLIFIDKLFCYLPYAQMFYSLLYSIISVSKMNHEFLYLSKDFLITCFKNQQFFNEFLEQNGFTKIFSSYYVEYDNKDEQEFFFNLLFKIVPICFYNIHNKHLSANLKFFIDLLSQQIDSNISQENSCLYVTHYLISFYSSNQTAFKIFSQMGGFFILNSLFIRNSKNIACEVYELLMIETNAEIEVVSNLLNLFQDSNINADFRSSLISIFNVHSNKNFEIYQKINNVAPISSLMIRPPYLNKDGLISLLSILKTYITQNMIKIEDVASNLLSIISPPFNNEIPIDEFLEVLLNSDIKKEIINDILIQNNFLEHFIFNPTSEEIAEYYINTNEPIKLIFSLFCGNISNESRNLIIQKFLSSLKFIENDKIPNFTSFIYRLTKFNLTAQSYKLILGQIYQNNIFLMLIKISSENENSASYFQESEGFVYLDEYLKKHQDGICNVYKLLISLCNYLPKKDIDEWIISKPINSPIYNIPKEQLLNLLQKLKDNYIFNIPSLYYFFNNVDLSSPTNLYLLGKFGIKEFEKRGIEIENIPNISLIANRYISVENANYLLSNPRKMVEYVDLKLPHFPLYEFIPIKGNAFIQFKQRSTSLSFWFNLPKKTELDIQIMKCGDLIIFVQNEVIIFKTKNSNIAFICPINAWNHIILSYTAQISIIKQIEIKFNENVSTISFEQKSDIFIFGDNEKPLPVPILISKSIYFSETTFSANQQKILENKYLSKITNNFQIFKSKYVYDVPYYGFATYFRKISQLAKLFNMLEKSKNFQDFQSTFELLIHLHIIHHFHIKKFWANIISSFKKKLNIVKKNFNYFCCDAIFNIYSNKTSSKILLLLLKDIEFYFIFDNKLISNWINHILAKDNINWEEFSDNDFIYFMLNLLRSGINEELMFCLIPLISKVISYESNKNKMQDYFNTILSLSGWKFENGIAILSNKSLEIQNELLIAFVDSLKLHYNYELFTELQVYSFMLHFGDKRAIILAEILPIYSYYNPKYISSSLLGSYIFQKFSTNEKMWEIALSILGGYLPESKSMHNFRIQRPKFLPIIFSMISNIASKCSKDAIDGNENQYFDLFKRFLNLFANLEISQYKFMSHQNNISFLSNLSSLGICPNSYASENYTRIENKWTKIGDSYSNKNEIIEALNTISFENKYNYENIKNFKENKLNDFEPIIIFPNELNDCKPLINLIKSTDFIQMFINIVFSVPPTNFYDYLIDIAMGNAFMYNEYWTFFSNNIILMSIEYLIPKKDLLNIYSKPLFNVVHNCIINNVFTNSFIDLFSLILKLLSSINDIKLFNESNFLDDKILKSYREILLLSFDYIPDGKINEYYLLIEKNSRVIFINTIFNDKLFSKFWLHLTRQFGGDTPGRIKCMKMFMNLIDNDLMKFYSSIDYQTEWLQYRSKFMKFHLDAKNYSIKFNRMNSIIDLKQQKYLIANKQKRIMEFYQSINYEEENKKLYYALNMIMRKLEKDSYDFSLLLQKYEFSNITNCSYYLSHLSYPLMISRLISPSPYKIKSPKINEVPDQNFYALDYTPKTQRVKLFQEKSIMQCTPQWFYFHQDKYEFSSPFEYSSFLPMENMISLLKNNYQITNVIQTFSIQFYFYIHSIPSILFITEESLVILTLAKLNLNKEIEFISEPDYPIGFLPFTEAVALGEFSQTSLFCGHIVIILKYHKLIKVCHHLYIHNNIGLSLYPIFSSNLIFVFDSTQDMLATEKIILQKSNLSKIFPSNNNRLLFTINSVDSAVSLWNSNVINNYEYLLLLNAFGGRSFFDLSQYPVAPWIASPELESRNLSKPMGQLNEARAKHYDQTYELSSPQYYYGFHYSLPGSVFWMLMRLPPYSFFQWDLNHGWDASQRLFYSANDTYKSAAALNPSDLKELIFQYYVIPEIFINICHFKFDESNGDVLLPKWTNQNPFFFTEKNFKYLNESNDINEWIDLIFGFKQNGEPAIKYKNLFHPSSYHNCKKEDLNMDEKAFKSQVNNFGQCPDQLFTKEHIKKSNLNFISLKSFKKKLESKKICIGNNEIPNNFYYILLNDEIVQLPKTSIIIPSYHTSTYILYIDVQKELLVIDEIQTKKHILTKYFSSSRYVSDLSISDDGIFIALTLEIGQVEIFQIIYEQNIPKSLVNCSSFSWIETSNKTVILASDYLCATTFTSKIILWNFATQLQHRQINILPGESILTMFFDSFNGFLILIKKNDVQQYSANGILVHEYRTEDEISCGCLLDFKPTFDGRFTILCHQDGSLSFLYVDSDDYSLKLLTKIKVHNFCISSIQVNILQNKIITTDVKGICYMTSFTKYKNMFKCYICKNKSTRKCANCQKPICDSCKHVKTNYCIKCMQNINNLSLSNM